MRGRGLNWPTSSIASLMQPLQRRVNRALRDRLTVEIVQNIGRGSAIEEQLALQIRAIKIAPPEREYKFLEHRRFKFDFAWPSSKIAVEVEGMVHRIKQRFESDIEKYALATLAGWTVLRVSGKTIRNGTAVVWIEQLVLSPRGRG